MGKQLIIFSYDFPPSDGGIARLCQEIASGMEVYYDDVIVLTRKKNGFSIPYNFKDIKIVALPTRRFFCEVSAILFLLKLKNKKQVSVLCGLWYPEGFLCFVAGLRNFYILGHGTEFLPGFSSFRKYIWLPFTAKFILKQSKCSIANSRYTEKLMRKVSPHASITALPLGVNPDFFKPTSNKKKNLKLKLVTVSRIQKFKGYDFIAKTISELPKNYQEKIEWNIGGTGAYLPELKLLISDLQLDHVVTFHGFVPDDKLPQFYSENDVFIMCTRALEGDTSVEGFGLVFLEAQSCGTPTIGTKSGGIPDAIHDGIGGWLIAQDNSKELTAILRKLIDNPDIVEDQSSIARQRILEKCTWELYCNRLNNMMQE